MEWVTYLNRRPLARKANVLTRLDDRPTRVFDKRTALIDIRTLAGDRAKTDAGEDAADATDATDANSYFARLLHLLKSKLLAATETTLLLREKMLLQLLLQLHAAHGLQQPQNSKPDQTISLTERQVLLTFLVISSNLFPSPPNSRSRCSTLRYFRLIGKF